MIDSICPRALNHQTQNIVPHNPFTSPHCKPEIGFLISNQLKASARLVQDWVMPHWSSRPWPISPNSRSWTGVTAFDGDQCPTAGSLSSHGSASSVSSSSRDRSWGSSTTASAFSSDDDIDDKPSPSPGLPIGNNSNNEGEYDNDGNPGSSPPPPPPPLTVLLRCDEYVPVSRSKNPDAISKVDIVRDRRLLGWDEYAPDLVQCVLNVPGHHFNLFAAENVSCSTPLFPTRSLALGDPKAEILGVACRLK